MEADASSTVLGGSLLMSSTTRLSPDTSLMMRVLWVDLIERVFGVDILRCPRCGGRRRMIAQITGPFALRKVLGYLGLRTEPLELSLARPPTRMRYTRQR